MDSACFEHTAATGRQSPLLRLQRAKSSGILQPDSSYSDISLKCTNLCLSFSLSHTCLHITSPPFQASERAKWIETTLSKVGARLPGAPRCTTQLCLTQLCLLLSLLSSGRFFFLKPSGDFHRHDVLWCACVWLCVWMWKNMLWWMCVSICLNWQVARSLGTKGSNNVGQVFKYPMMKHVVWHQKEKVLSGVLDWH